MADSTRDLTVAEQAFRSGDHGLAEGMLRQILASQPRHSRANELMAYLAGNRGELERAFTHLKTATRSRDATATSWYYLGAWYLMKGRSEEAADAFRKSLRLDDRLFECHHDLGRAYFQLGQPERALEAYRRALAIDSGSYAALHNKGRALHALRQYDAALENYDKALALKPDLAATWLNRGEVLNDLRRHDEALASYAKALALKPDYDDAQWNESLTRLVLGQFRIGWPKYEFRWKGELAWPRRHSGIPAWLGEQSIAGKRLLVWWEQGFGDTLHFCRYVPLLAAKGADVIFEVQPSFKFLMASLPGCTVIASGEPLPACDFQIPLLSLPRVFDTVLETIPATVPYLHADPARIEAWGRRLPRNGARPRIGIACSGHSAQKDNTQRSMTLRDFAPLQEMGDLYLIQKGLPADDRRYLRERGTSIVSLDASIADFADSAAIVENMDLVVTIDTALAHLAGALGKTVWILLPWTPTWRWLVDRSDSPWYPTARLFRQATPGDWAGVIGKVKDALPGFAGN